MYELENITMKTIEKIYDEITSIFKDDAFANGSGAEVASQRMTAFLYFIKGEKQNKSSFYQELNSYIVKFDEELEDYVPVPFPEDLFNRLTQFCVTHNIKVIENGFSELDFDNVRGDQTSFIVFSYDDKMVKVIFAIDSYGTTIGGSIYERGKSPTFDLLLVNKVTKTVNLYE